MESDLQSQTEIKTMRESVFPSPNFDLSKKTPETGAIKYRLAVDIF